MCSMSTEPFYIFALLSFMAQIDLGAPLALPLSLEEAEVRHGEVLETAEGRQEDRPEHGPQEARPEHDRPEVRQEVRAEHHPPEVRPEHAPQEVRQIDLGLALALPEPKKLNFAQRSAEHISHARSVLMRNVAKRQAGTAEARATTAEQVVDTLAAAIPDASKIIGRTSTTAIGRRKNLQPYDFTVISRAIHLGRSTKLKLGSKRKRLVTMASNIALRRQKKAVSGLVKSASKHVRGPAASPDTRHIHLSYSHSWDEVNAKYVHRRDRKYRGLKTVNHQQTIGQRGRMCIGMGDFVNKRSTNFFESWICKPFHVEGTSAPALYPAILQALPEELNWQKVAKVQDTMSDVTSATIFLMGDKASGNVSMMKKVVGLWKSEVMAATNHKLKLFPESCGIHLHHRAKLQLKPSKFHVMRHYSIANLCRLQNIQQLQVSWLETEIPNKMERKVGQPPCGDMPVLRDVVDILYEAELKSRAEKKKKSFRFDDLDDLRQLCNNDLNGEFIHWCHNLANGRPCCKSTSEAAEKMTVAVANCLTPADPVPAESKWTYTLTNFKKRYYVHRFTIWAWSPSALCKLKLPVPRPRSTAKLQKIITMKSVVHVLSRGVLRGPQEPL